MNYIRLQGRVHLLIKNAANSLQLNFRRQTQSDDPLAEPGQDVVTITQTLYAVYLPRSSSTFLQSLLSAIGQSKADVAENRLLISPVGLKWDLRSGDEVEIDSEWLTLDGVDLVSPDRKTKLLLKTNIKSS